MQIRSNQLNNLPSGEVASIKNFSTKYNQVQGPQQFIKPLAPPSIQFAANDVIKENDGNSSGDSVNINMGKRYG